MMMEGQRLIRCSIMLWLSVALVVGSRWLVTAVMAKRLLFQTTAGSSFVHNNLSSFWRCNRQVDVADDVANGGAVCSCCCGRQSVWWRVSPIASSCHRPTTFTALAAAGGFGSSSSSSKQGNLKTKNKSTTTTTTRKRKGGFLENNKEEITGTTPQQPSTSSSIPATQLDKWGLPIVVPTEDDIFPPLPPGTELIAVNPNRQPQYTLQDIQQALLPHLQLPGLHHYFDEQGMEKRQQQQQQQQSETTNIISPESTTATTSTTNNNRPPMKLGLIHQSPPILVIDNFLSEEECRQVQATVTTSTNHNVDDDDHHETSPLTAYQVNSATFASAISKRTSTSWFCHYQQLPTLLAKMHHVLGTPLSVMEEPQIVRYQSGQEFSYHYDQVPPSLLDNGGQRLATFLVYLNHVPIDGGGGTIFRDLRTSYGSHGDDQPLTVQPQQGMACIFFPAFTDGRPDDRTLHKGQVITGGKKDCEKWICQIWIHERSYQPVLPPGNSQDAAWRVIQDASQQLGFF